jgi:hypothetical protein
MEREKAREVVALVQPNSDDSGTKKTPKEKFAPFLTARITVVIRIII